MIFKKKNIILVLGFFFTLFITQSLHSSDNFRPSIQSCLKTKRKNITEQRIDLSPYYLTNNDFRVVHLLKLKKKYGEGIKKIDEIITQGKNELPPDVLPILKGFLLLEEGRVEEGINILKDFKDHEFLHDHINYLIANAYLKIKEFNRAKEFYSLVSENHFGFIEARLFLVEFFIKEKELLLANSILNDLLLRNLDNPIKQNVLLKLADIYLLEGEKQKARDICFHLYLKGKEKKRAKECMKNGENPLKAVENILYQIINSDKKNLRKFFLQINKNKKIFSKIDKGLLFFASGEYQRVVWENMEIAINFYKKALSNIENPELRRITLQKLALVLRKKGLEKEAINVYQELLNKYPEHPENPDVILNTIYLLLKVGEGGKALKLYKKSISKFPSIKKEGMWLFAMDDFYNERFKESEKKINKIIKQEKFLKRIPSRKLLYWKARVELEVGKTAKAFEDFFTLSNKSPLSYYGLFATTWIKEKFSPDFSPKILFTINSDSGSCDFSKFGKNISISQDIIFFIKAGLYKIAFSNLNWRLKQRKLTEDEKIVYACVYHRLFNKNNFRKMAGIGNIISILLSENSNNFYKLFFPRPYKEYVDNISRENDIPSELIYALMMYESNFDEDALSHKGAIGLMQIIPRTAKYVRGKLSNPPSHSLYKPEVNIKIAGLYLGELIKYFKGNFILALLAYNAGNSFAQRRYMENKGREMDILVETLPSIQMKNYIKKIVSAYGKYSMLYNKNNPYPSLPLNLPQRIGPFADLFELDL